MLKLKLFVISIGRLLCAFHPATPIPSCPLLLYPQAKTLPSLVITKAWDAKLTSVIVSPALKIKLLVISIGVGFASSPLVDPFPSCPW